MLRPAHQTILSGDSNMTLRAGLPWAIVLFFAAGVSVTGCTTPDMGTLPDQGPASGADMSPTPLILSVMNLGSGSGTVTAEGTPLNCVTGQTQDCSASIVSGTMVTLKATTGTNSFFAGWSGACSGNALTCTLTMNEALSVTAQFNIVQDNLQVLITGSGKGTVTSTPAGIDCGNFPGAPMACSQTLSQGSTITLTATAQSGSQFAGWSGGGCSGTATTCVVSISQAQMVTATFNAIQLTAPLVSSISQGQTSQGQVQALGLNYYIATLGVFPSPNGSAISSGSPYVGQIMLFAGGFAPTGWVPCDGALLPIAANAPLFSLIGTIYGGNGTTHFAVPDLRAHVPMGTGTLQGGTIPASSPGVSAVPLMSSVAWGATSQGQAQVLGVNYYIASYGFFPSQGGGSVTSTWPYVGQLMLFAGNFAPAGWYPCDGRLLNIATNAAVFSLLGTMYGGNGTTNFALPDLRARAPMGVGALTNPSNPPQSPTQVPLISSVVEGEINHGQIGVLGMNYLIAGQGIFPSQGGGSANSSGAYLGQFLLFAGNFAPSGWLPANGTTLNISTNTALFSLLGTTYGGNGTTTFALPDLRGRVTMGVGSP
jgi:microcystin-dependent protein